jgi:nucleotide-binding universal stress UspA family protein
MKVLIAADASRSSHQIVQAAAKRPWPAGSTFCLMTVVDPFFFTKAPALLTNAKESALRYLETEAELLTGSGWKATSEVVLGNPRRAISLLARDWEADLVMAGSQGLSATERLFLGSTAQSLLRRAPCSVEIVRIPTGQASGEDGIKLLVATDGSEFSLAAIKSVASRPWPKGTQAKIISVPQLALPFVESSYADSQALDDLNKASIEESNSAVAEGLAILSRTELKLFSEVPFLHETASNAILMEVDRWHPTMIVVGSHGRSGFDRFMMGSVSEAVALHAKCSVEVIRDRAAQAEKEQKSKSLGVWSKF